MPSIRQSAAAWASDCPSADRLWSGIKAASGRNRTLGRAPHSRFPYHWNQYQGLMDSGRQTDPSLSGEGCQMEVMGQQPLVSVVDDDESVRESLPDLLRQCGFAAQAFSSAEAFLASEAVGETRCLILDIAMPGMSGPDLQQELSRRRQEIPI